VVGKVDGGEEREAGGEERVEERGQSVSPKIHALIADLEEAIENAGAHGRGANMSSVGGRTEDGRGEESTAAEQGIGGVGVGGGGGDIKAVVFSQFLGCLDEVGAALARSGLAFGRLQGNLSLEQRREVRGARCAYVVEYLRLCRCADIKTQ